MMANTNAAAIFSAIILRARRANSSKNGMCLRSSFINATPAELVAMSLPESPMATPTSALASAGASLMPSPAIATMRPSRCNLSTSASLSAFASAQVAGKPPAAVQKIVEGKIEKFYAGVVLLDQPYVKEPEKSIKEILTEAIAKTGENIQVRRFIRYQLGS